MSGYYSNYDDSAFIEDIKNFKLVTPPYDILEGILFKSIPAAEIYGIYVAQHILKQKELCSEINIIINEIDIPLVRLFLYMCDEDGYLVEYKTRAFCQKFEYQIKLNIKQKSFLVIISINSPITKVHFLCNCLKMDRDHNISLLLRDATMSNIELMDKAYEHILKKILKIQGSFDNIGTLYEIRASYIKLVRDAVSLIDQGWKLKDDLNFKIYEGTRDDTCAICHESILKGSCLRLKCEHVFHLDCINESLHISGPPGGRCPVCRTEIISYDYSKKKFI